MSYPKPSMKQVPSPNYGFPQGTQGRAGHQVIAMIVRMSEERQAGNRMKIYECQSEIDGLMRRFELKFELNTCKWFLWKI